MDFAIIAAGEGSRLKEEGIDFPKGLVKINGRPMIERLVEIAARHGADSLSCIVNDHSHDLLGWFVNNNHPIKINLTVKSTASSMHSLFELRRFLEGRDFCLTTVDTIFKEDEFNDFINYCKNNNGKAVIAVTDYIDDEKPLYTRIDNDMNILSFDDEINGHTYVTGGIYYLPGTIFGLLEKLINSGEMHLRNFQRSLISAGYEVKAWPFTKIVDVDHISDIKAAEEFVSAYTKY